VDKARVNCCKKSKNPENRFNPQTCSKQSPISFPKKASNPHKKQDINRGVWKTKNFP
jgi:hypothetical protein